MTVLTDVRADWNDVLAPSRLFDEGGSWVTNLPIGDTFEGEVIDPQSLHKYAYCHGDPVNFSDPTGRMGIFTAWNQWFGYEVEDEIEKEYANDYGNIGVTYGNWARLPGEFRVFRARPDILDHNRQKYMEIKPLSPSGVLAADAQMALRLQQFDGLGYSPDTTWHLKPSVIYPWGIPTLFMNLGGVLFYTDAVDALVDYAVLRTLKDALTFVNSGRLAFTIESALGRITGLVAQETAIEGTRMENGIGSMMLLAII
jgi:hypothetical protein